MFSVRFLACAASVLTFGSPRLLGADEECFAWRQRIPDGPPALAGHAMAFDSVRGVTVLFGGYDDQGRAPTGIWEWDGATWAMKIATGPGPRSGHAMAFDSARGVTVLFGGPWDIRGSETWEWDGAIWTLRSTTGPHPRRGHAMVYDSVRGVTVLFGGYYYDPNAGTYDRDVYLNDTWEWDGSHWTQRLVASPPARVKHAMVFDSSRQRTVLFGGCHGDCRSANQFGDTWEWDGMAWSQASSEGPSPRTEHAMTYDSSRHVTLLLSGSSDAYSDSGETWAWNGETWTRLDVQAPSKRFESTMVFDTWRAVGVLYGGAAAYPSVATYAVTGETWEWDGAKWEFRESGDPGKRQGHAMAFDSKRGVTVLFGGESGSIPRVGTWEWDGVSWRLAGRNPGLGRSHHAMAYDSKRGVTVTRYGDGWSVGEETWEWDGTTWTPHKALGPEAEPGYVMAYDHARGETVLYDTRGRTWGWNGVAWTLRAREGPVERSSAAMVYDAARSVCVLFGGDYWDPVQRTSVFLGDTWEWNGVEWALRSLDGPPPRSAHTMSYDEARGVTVLFGGLHAGDALRDTWEWDGTSWIERNFVGPTARYETASAYDSVRHVVIVFGGFYLDSYVQETLADTWEYAPGRIVDGDADGVADSCDSCPTTTAGTVTDTTGCSPIDADLDGDIDLLDFAAFQRCIGAREPTGACARFNVHRDYRIGSIDRFDFIGFDQLVTGPK